VLLQVHACGICRTDLHVVDGELAGGQRPIVPGHQIVGTVAAAGSEVSPELVGTRLGVPWLAWTCGTCAYCTAGQENLCDRARFTGFDVDGGFADYTVADARYCLRLPEGLDDLHLAPLLCAGLIGFRALRLTGDARRVGMYGFGAAAHLLAQVARHQGREVYAFTRRGDAEAAQLALELGAKWAGSSDEPPPVPLDAALIFAPVGGLVPLALRAVRKGGVVVCAGIHMSDIPSFSYDLLWGERSLRSVANLTRADGEQYLALVPAVRPRVLATPYALIDANRALDDLRAGRVQGAAVLLTSA
jgi:propanol-preferring alcohol dehydrogenase